MAFVLQAVFGFKSQYFQMWLFFIPVLLIVSVFFFVFIANVTGLVPYYFTVTSHLILTFSVALTTFIVFVISLFL